ncbi:MAG: hypothetical protein LBL75_00700 [Rickettsiales bacterium]|jgi:hypothetical protein|nr:hypothetical protein [Rickettsiales bacterium]
MHQHKLTTGQIIKLTDKLRLTPFQVMMMTEHGDRYNIEKLVKKGDVLYAPLRKSVFNFFGARADLIGASKVLVRENRRIKLYPTGFYSVGLKYFDPMGRQLTRKLFYKIV